MRVLLAGILLLLLPATAWGPLQHHYWEPPVEHARAYVEAKARQYGVPEELALAVWQMESSQRTEVQDGRANERGSFQVTEAAATDVGCRWSAMRLFRVSTDCGLRYLARSLALCGTNLHAAHKYNRGHCPRNGKIWGYAQAVGKLMMKYQPTT
ncbi:hypothetical protein LCGC14_1273180 [marine sediment metagenome]|uniref:Transglycosylase SLT domain-containing protein n=1 Tax=marine sediment metagenome TaxID=412755 RepID=A0A0F9KXF0_9ZZZZ